jgi:Tfp pilus assembly protein PilF
MCSDPSQPGHQEALELWQRGYIQQATNDLDGAARLYAESIDLHPTAEAWTFMGWIASIRGDYHQAIERCERAISVDPTFGNPYNDIGAYLLELGRAEQAVPWLQRAVEAPRYEARVYPWMNLGRAFEQLGQLKQAVEHYRKATEVDPRYGPAARALDRLLARRNGKLSSAP